MNDIKTEVVVLGSGPGGYSAAFRAADLGKKVVLIEKHENIGGVCLNVGCIPSKALLHVSKVMNEIKHLKKDGLVDFDNFSYNKEKILSYKDNIVKKLTLGLKYLANQRKVKIIRGFGKFVSKNKISVQTPSGEHKEVFFEKAIIAVGSRPVKLPFIPEDPRIIDSTGALQIKEVPKKMLVIGGGIIGLEMAQVYSELGSKITVVEFQDQLMGAADPDIVKPYENMMSSSYDIRLNTKVTKVDASCPKGLNVSMLNELNKKDITETFDRILLAVGRVPNGNSIDARKIGLDVNDSGFIKVDSQLRTNISNIFAIGDVIGQPMLAHKSVAEGRIAAEVISGKNHSFQAKCIPSVAYTDPEVAWVGLTEKEAKEKNIDYETGVFPWAASGRSLSVGRSEGLTKMIYDKNHRILGAGIVGPNAGELIAEVSLAIEMGCVAEDISLTIHPHPTLSETVMMATEVYEGNSTDTYSPKK